MSSVLRSSATIPSPAVPKMISPRVTSGLEVASTEKGSFLTASISPVFSESTKRELSDRKYMAPSCMDGDDERKRIPSSLFAQSSLPVRASLAYIAPHCTLPISTSSSGLNDKVQVVPSRCDQDELFQISRPVLASSATSPFPAPAKTVPLLASIA